MNISSYAYLGIVVVSLSAAGLYAYTRRKNTAVAIAMLSLVFWVAITLECAFGTRVVVAASTSAVAPGPHPWFTDPAGDRQYILFPSYAVDGKSVDILGTQRLFFGWPDGKVRYIYKLGGLTVDHVPEGPPGHRPSDQGQP